MDPTATHPASLPLPVTVVVSRRPVPGASTELLQWARGISHAASQFPGHLGAQIYEPAPPGCEDLVIAFSFANAADLSGWENSDERRSWIDRAREITVGTQTAHGLSGFEGIFAPVARASTAPPRWKTAAVIAMALYPASLLINWLLVPHLGSWNLFLRVLLTTALIVPSWCGPASRGSRLGCTPGCAGAGRATSRPRDGAPVARASDVGLSPHSDRSAALRWRDFVSRWAPAITRVTWRWRFSPISAEDPVMEMAATANP